MFVILEVESQLTNLFMATVVTRTCFVLRVKKIQLSQTNIFSNQGTGKGKELCMQLLVSNLKMEDQVHEDKEGNVIT